MLGVWVGLLPPAPASLKCQGDGVPQMAVGAVVGQIPSFAFSSSILECRRWSILQTGK
jgi:hypothetical protein